MKLLEDARLKARFGASLLDWYGQHKRQLIWRDSDDPYHIWLSEVMLQQTRVDQMGPYFERFIAAFPTVEALATAPEDAVLKAWEGLGYYARARNLQKAARTIVAEHGGRVPDTYEGLIGLPGVGEYTAAAVSSIAFDRDHPVLDGNVTRVLCRLLRIEGEPRRAAVKAELVAAGEALLVAGRAGDFNQAMMELGARVCTPQKPACGGCPVGAFCRARAELEDPTVLPRKTPKKARPHYAMAAGVVWKDEKLMIVQRPAEGLLGGLWGFPGGRQEGGETLEVCLLRQIDAVLGFAVEVEEPLTKVEHAYSHFSITLHVFGARYQSGQPQAIQCADWRWIEPAQLDEFALSRADRKVVEFLRRADEGQMDLFTPNTSERKK